MRRLLKHLVRLDPKLIKICGRSWKQRSERRMCKGLLRRKKEKSPLLHVLLWKWKVRVKDCSSLFDSDVRLDPKIIRICGRSWKQRIERRICKGLLRRKNEKSPLWNWRVWVKNCSSLFYSGVIDLLEGMARFRGAGWSRLAWLFPLPPFNDGECFQASENWWESFMREFIVTLGLHVVRIVFVLNNHIWTYEKRLADEVNLVFPNLNFLLSGSCEGVHVLVCDAQINLSIFSSCFLQIPSTSSNFLTIHYSLY